MKIALTKSRSSFFRYYLIKDGKGMGGAGQDKGHYLNNYVVVYGQDRGNGYQGYMSVDYFLTEIAWVPDEAKEIVRKELGI